MLSCFQRNRGHLSVLQLFPTLSSTHSSVGQEFGQGAAKLALFYSMNSGALQLNGWALAGWLDCGRVLDPRSCRELGFSALHVVSLHSLPGLPRNMGVKVSAFLCGGWLPPERKWSCQVS